MKIHIITIISIAFLLVCCSDNAPDFPTNSSVEENEDSRISSFDINPDLLDGALISKIGYANLKKGFFTLETYNAELRHLGSSVRCGLHLGTSSNLEDGEYLLTFSDTDGRPLEGMLRIEVKEDKVMKVGEAKGSFSLRSGSGTKEDPYIIGSSRDFLMFLDDLRKNELTNGRDVWFKQTSDITLMDQSSTKPGRGYFGYSFAGHYDGGGYALKDMYYRGAEDKVSDSNIGIFPSLLDGAEISNLEITGVNISNVYSDTGTLAGTSIGSVYISGVSIQGFINSDKATEIGGLIGRITHGAVRVSDISLKMAIAANANVGGIIGRMDSGTLSLSGLTTPYQHFSVEGHTNTGGAIGSAGDGILDITDVSLAHVVSKEDGDVRTIQNTGGNATGGVIGYINGSSTSLSLSDISVGCPVGGLNRCGYRIGGLIGDASCGKDLTINGCRITSIVSGASDVGGFIGHCSLTNGARLIIKGDSKANYILPDDSAAGIEAISNAGGAFGHYEGSSLEADDNTVRIAVNVNVSEKNAGGAFGQVKDTNLRLSIFDMTSSTMQVTGNENIGGLVGSATSSTFSGSTPFDYPMSEGKAVVPSADDFEPIFSGIVKGSLNVGGVVGYAENTSLKALATACSVTSLGRDNIGGIAGYVVTSGRDNRFEDLVSGSSVLAASQTAIGGIFGYFECDDYSYVTDCINFGDVNGGHCTGGIFGLYHKYLYVYNMESMKAPEIHWSLNAGEVTGANCVGGIIGKCTTKSSNYYDMTTNLMVYKCGNNGKVSSHVAGASTTGVGGIIGYGEAFIEVSKCSNNATISSTEGHKGVGGIAGSLGIDPIGVSSDCLNVKVHNCVNRGTIDSKNASSHVGGVLGFMEEGPDSHLYDCLNNGKVLNKHNSDNGGILGYTDHLGKIYRCVNLGNVEHGNATIGTHKSGSAFYHEDLYFLDGTGKNWPSAKGVSSADIGKKESFPGLNFNGAWDISESGPDLRDCPF